MNQPELNPSTIPGLAGRSRRHLSGPTHAIRTIRTDLATERSIDTVRDWLNGQISKGDVVSVSMLGRRAIACYRQHLQAMKPQQLEQEKIEVRRDSRLPNPEARKRTREKK